MKSEAEPQFASRIETELKDLNVQWEHICQQVSSLPLWLVHFKLMIRFLTGRVCPCMHTQFEIPDMCILYIPDMKLNVDIFGSC